jgi:hypothetical protein
LKEKTMAEPITFTITKCRGGYHVNVQAPYDEDTGEDGEAEDFVLAGETLDPTELGKQLVASMVSLRMETPKKKRR